ncbi:MAG: hypothetical protein ABSG15_12990, partial [FCB group bacterium]
MKTFKILSVVITIFIFLTSYAKAKIIYTPINRTLSATLEQGTSEEIEIDLNKDSKADFGFYHFYPSINCRYGEIFSVGLTLGNEVCTDENYVPFKFNNGDIISQDLSGWLDTYNNSNLCILGHWSPSISNFIAVRLIINGNIYYGWFRLSIPSDSSSMTIIDCAIEDTPGQSIIAGDMGTGVNENLILKNISVYSFDKKLSVDLQGSNQINTAAIIFDIYGNQVMSIILENKINII